jgi:maleate isomerase
VSIIFRAKGSKLFTANQHGLPSDQQAIQPEQLFNWVRTHVPAQAEAVFIGGNGFRAVSVIKALEDSSGPLF